MVMEDEWEMVRFRGRGREAMSRKGRSKKAVEDLQNAIENEWWISRLCSLLI